MPQGEIDSAELREQDHSRHWNRALHRAIQDAVENDLAPGASATYDVQLQFNITREKNPGEGWADGYKVVLTKQ